MYILNYNFIDGKLTDTYSYDGLNQLIRHDDAKTGKTYTYAYDEGGNILSEKEYAYTTGTLGSVLDEKIYGYDATWKDKLVSYDGNTVTYDEIGNPLTYRGYTFTWEKGRKLSGVSGNGENLTYRYDAEGLRIQKTSGSRSTEYDYSGGLLVSTYDGTDRICFVYTADGQVTGFTLNGKPYYYRRNLQGDVIGILDQNAELVCSYTYDAWGVCSVYDADGKENTEETFIGNVNPLRYRGYYYDAETGLYYLGSRYYGVPS